MTFNRLCTVYNIAYVVPQVQRYVKYAIDSRCMDLLPSYWPNSTEIRHLSHGFVFIFFSPGSAAIETSLDNSHC